MTILLVDVLENELMQEFNLKLDKRYCIGAYIPYIYMHNAPSGDFLFEIIKDSEVIFSKSFTCADLKSALNTSDNYAHLFMPIVPSTPLQQGKGLFTARISSDNYSGNDSSFIGWIKQFEDLNNELDYDPGESSLNNPLAMRLKIRDGNMVRQVDFADGFSSASAPIAAGSMQQNFNLNNNQSAPTDVVDQDGNPFILDSAKYFSAFMSIEVERIGSVTYRQTIDVQAYYTGTQWRLTLGNFSGSDITVDGNDSITLPQQVLLTISNSGTLRYATGNQSGHVSSKLKISITRMAK